MIAYAFYDNDTRIQQYTQALVERGDAVDVIALGRNGQAPCEVLDGVTVHRIQVRVRDERGPLWYLLKMLQFLIRSAVFVTTAHLKKPYQLVHVHSVPDFLVFAAIAPKLGKVPIILDIHDILPELYASKFKLDHGSFLFKGLLSIERVCARYSHHVIIANHLWHERLISRTVDRTNCTPICNYPDPAIFFPRPKTSTDGKFIMLYPGTLNHFQGVDLAIKAFAKVEAVAPHAELHIYGEGPEKMGLMNLTKQLRLERRILFSDFVPVKEIADVMGQAHLGVVPKRAGSFSNEAVSGKVAEFQALGVPVLESRTKVGTYYNDSSRVMFFEPENVDDLADCMLRLIRDTQLRERLAANALKHRQENNWRSKKREYLRLVDSLVSGRPLPQEQQRDIAHWQGSDAQRSQTSAIPRD